MSETVKLEHARGELNKAINDISNKHRLTAIELEGILCKMIVDLSWSARIDMINNCESEKRYLTEANEELREENSRLKKELEKAKAAEEKRPKTESDAEQEEGDSDGNGTNN